MSLASSGNNSTDLLDFQSFQLNPGQIYQDASINNSDKQLLNELVSKPEQRLYFKDINKDSITKNIDSFQNSLDSLSDYFSFSPYTFDNGISFEGGTSDDPSKKDDDDSDGDDDAIAAKKQKLSEEQVYADGVIMFKISFRRILALIMLSIIGIDKIL
ncbi:hypothetical protein HELRODRAFT_158473 [Helobdella robusta]|uniref:Uncharacterized protein n=1 Tax=Helobdella robusta TaxID=6412 RepID=T1EMU3_HELRO|nr:hypothetical protein HELRODRAFT_158473 [Helobdella robusta]ESO12065.1 hypothetical protein HELRODRAFT_158473 [Helobdella robusta]